MRCHICNSELSDTEVQFSEDPKHKLEPCKVCLDVALDAAYSEGFTPGSEPTGLVENDQFTESEFPSENNQLSFFT